MTTVLSAQVDTTTRLVPTDSLNKIADTSIRQKKKVDSALVYHSPRKAAIRSAILPGWGQAYNKKYWKIPIVYAGLGISGAIFISNLKTYRNLRFAVQAKTKALPPPAGQNDPSDLDKIKPEQLKQYDLEALRYNRNEFRRNIDYSALVFILLWGLNVIDASVDAHLRGFDISPDLSFKLKPGYSPLAQTNGISFIIAFK